MSPLLGTPREEFFVKGSVANRRLVRWLVRERGEREREAAEEGTVAEIPVGFTLPLGSQVGEGARAVGARAWIASRRVDVRGATVPAAYHSSAAPALESGMPFQEPSAWLTVQLPSCRWRS